MTPGPSGLPADEALRRGEARFRALAQATLQVVWTWCPTDGTGDFAQAQRWWEEVTGQTPQEQSAGLVGWLAAVHPDDRDLAVPAWADPSRPGTPYDVEYRLRGRAGGWLHVRARGVPILDAAGAVREWVGTLEDVTEERRARQRLRDSERMLAQSQRAAHVGSWELDLGNLDDVNANPLRWSDETYRIFGYEPGSVAVSNELFFRAVHPDDRAAIAAAVAAALRANQNYEIENRILRPDGAWRVVRQWARIEREAGGRPVRMCGTCQDVTEQAATREALREGEERLRLALEAGGCGVWDWDMANNHVTRSERVHQFLGLRPGDLGGSVADFAARVHPEDVGRVSEAIRRAVEDGAAYAAEMRIVRPGGEVRWLSDTGRVLRDAAGRAVRMLGATLDVTERKAAEAALVEADHRKDEFLAMLGHELRNPLAPIRNGLALLRHRAGGDPAAAPVLALMERQVAHAVRLIDDLLDVSRVTSGKIELRKERVLLADVAAAAVEEARPDLEGRAHQLELNVAAEPLTLDADPARVQQILSNLLTNAAKYTPPGGHVALTVGREGGEAVVRVRDDGIGIRPEMLRRIFEMFTQADRVEGRASEGLGLGLPLVRRLAALHGGSVEAHSDGPGRGSEFVVRLPLAKDEGQGSTDKIDPASCPSSFVLRPCQRVLVVDDNSDAAASLAMLLHTGGHEVRVAHDGPAALATAELFSPQAVILDIGMPGMNGYEVARRLRSRPGLPRLLLIAMTGYGQDEDRRRSREAGFDHHLVKPVDLDAIAELLAANRSLA